MRFLWILSIVFGAIGLLIALGGILLILSDLDRPGQDLLTGLGFALVGTAVATVPYSLISSIEKLRG